MGLLPEGGRAQPGGSPGRGMLLRRKKRTAHTHKRVITPKGFLIGSAPAAHLVVPVGHARPPPSLRCSAAFCQERNRSHPFPTQTQDALGKSRVAGKRGGNGGSSSLSFSQAGAPHVRYPRNPRNSTPGGGGDQCARMRSRGSRHLWLGPPSVGLPPPVPSGCASCGRSPVGGEPGRGLRSTHTQV